MTLLPEFFSRYSLKGPMANGDSQINLPSKPPRSARPASRTKADLIRLLAQIAVDEFLEERNAEGNHHAVNCHDREDQ